ncbi:hypothetical protein DENSPDRAFT_831763 [Dentipellis sp. KUC8613]|nr:hypothetical protein DENSPDRAFT_831763 [Dentipellis sp. KUC8613]
MDTFTDFQDISDIHDSQGSTSNSSSSSPYSMSLADGEHDGGGGARFFCVIA